MFQEGQSLRKLRRLSKGRDASNRQIRCFSLFDLLTNRCFGFDWLTKVPFQLLAEVSIPLVRPFLRPALRRFLTNLDEFDRFLVFGRWSLSAIGPLERGITW